MSVGPCSIDQNNAAPLKEASRNPDAIRVVDRAMSFRLLHSDTQEIGSCTFSTGAVPVLMLAVAGATIECPGPSHAGLFFLWRRESKNVGSLSKSSHTRRGDRYCRPANPRRIVAVKSRIVTSSFSRVRQVPRHML